MTNKAGAKKHGMHRIERLRTSKIARLKKNKEGLRAGQAARQKAIAEALAAGNE
ncbi:hypothetical protein IPN35_03385 [Candidatus Peregrinibacteria bacterium]|nr:MAG: hypothetical protein IPN35_03385 [Candidatus Peregrinibacteria bacterium]